MSCSIINRNTLGIRSNIRCVVKCSFCGLRISCTRGSHWKISNFANHITNHENLVEKSLEKSPIDNTTNIKPAESVVYPSVLYTSNVASNEEELQNILNSEVYLFYFTRYFNHYSKPNKFCYT